MAKTIELELVTGIIEYRYDDQRMAHLPDEEKEAICFFTKEFHNLPELLQLVSPMQIESLRLQNGYERVWVESIQLLAKDPLGQVQVETMLTWQDGNSVELMTAS